MWIYIVAVFTIIFPVYNNILTIYMTDKNKHFNTNRQKTD